MSRKTITDAERKEVDIILQRMAEEFANKHVEVPESDRLDVEEQTSLVEYQQQQEEDSR